MRAQWRLWPRWCQHRKHPWITDNFQPVLLLSLSCVSIQFQCGTLHRRHNTPEITGNWAVFLLKDTKKRLVVNRPFRLWDVFIMLYANLDEILEILKETENQGVEEHKRASFINLMLFPRVEILKWNINKSLKKCRVHDELCLKSCWKNETKRADEKKGLL